MPMDQYLLILFLGDEHPFTSYFDVHQGYKVLTHCHMFHIVYGQLEGIPHFQTQVVDYHPPGSRPSTRWD